MSELIDGLLSFSKLGWHKIERHDVNLEKMAVQVFEELAPDDRKIEFTCGQVGMAWGDPFLLRQVLSNLISNAIKFTRDAHPAKLESGAVMQGERKVFFIKDNGAGFDMKHADRLFGVFKRLHSSTEYEGSGVGLAIVKKIIERHGGQIRAESGGR